MREGMDSFFGFERKSYL